MPNEMTEHIDFDSVRRLFFKLDDTQRSELIAEAERERQRKQVGVSSSDKAHVPQKTGKSLYGLWADLGIDITEQDIQEARKDMWGNFPRDDI